MSELNVTLIENEADSTAVQLNRKATDGSIIDLQKDGSTVGSIASDSNGRVIYNSENNAGYIGVNGTRRYYWTGTDLSPMTDGGPDLGASSFRFKDLYLSGGVYLGGTGAANYLDDYEEGTFTPYITGFSSSSYYAQNGKYTKIGDAVLFNIKIAVASGTWYLSSSCKVGGLPFTSQNVSNSEVTASIFPISGFENMGDGGITVEFGPNKTEIDMYYVTQSSSLNYNTITNAHISEGNLNFTLSGWYKAA